MNQPSLAPSLRTPPGLASLLLVLATGLGACGESAEPGLLVLDRDAHDFGQLHVGAISAEQTFTVRNAGLDALDDLSVRFEPAGSFALLATTCAGWLQPGDTCAITVAFAPAQAGAAQADLVVEADRADASAGLAGVGAVTVRVANDFADGTVVESEPAGIRCGAVCEATFTVPEIVLSVARAGIPVWSESCELTPGGDCALALRGDMQVTLHDLTGLQWTAAGGDHRAIAADGQGNVIGVSYEAPFLYKLAPSGALSWQREDLGGGFGVAVDAQGNIGFCGTDGFVTKLDGAGNTLWSIPGEQIGLAAIDQMAFDPSGALYLTGAQEALPEQAGMVLAKLDRDGNVLWFRAQEPGLGNHWLGLVVDGSGNAMLKSNGGYLRKYNGNGDVMWTHTEYYAALGADAAGNVLVAIGSGLRKYAPDGTVLWEVPPEDGTFVIDELAVTPAGDAIAMGTRKAADGSVIGTWAVQFEGADGTQRRPVELVEGEDFSWHISVDGNGDVVLASTTGDFGLRKYDAAVFDRPAE